MEHLGEYFTALGAAQAVQVQTAKLILQDDEAQQLLNAAHLLIKEAATKERAALDRMIKSNSLAARPY